MANDRHSYSRHERWQTILTGMLVIIGLAYTLAAVFQWLTMREQARQMAEQSNTTTAQLNAMKEDIKSNKANRSADFIFRFDDKLYKSSLSQIRTRIEDGKPILKAHGGPFNNDELDRYLDIFETMQDVSANGLMSDDMIDSAYGHVLQKAYQNHEIQGYLQQIRKDDPDFYSGFEQLAKSILARNPAKK